MSEVYDQYYQTENLFGNPYPALIQFFALFPAKGNVLDLGCGQGRNAIPLAQMGFKVVGIDSSKVGINQLMATAQKVQLPLTACLGNMYDYTNFSEFDFILMDSMFHFTKKDRTRELKLLERIFLSIKPNAVVVICIQRTGSKLDTLKALVEEADHLVVIAEKNFDYLFVDQASDHHSKTPYVLLGVQKQYQ